MAQDGGVGLFRTARLGRNIWSGIAGQASGIAVSLATTPVIIRGLGASNYGLWNVALAIGSWVGMANMVFSTSAVYYVGHALGAHDAAGAREAETGLTFWALIYAVFSAAALAVSSPLIAGRILNLRPREVFLAVHVLWAQAFMVFFQISSSAFSGMVTAYERLDWVNAARACGAALQGIGAAVLVFMGHGLLSVAWWVCAVEALLFVVFMLCVQVLSKGESRRPYKTLDLASWHGRLVRYGAGLWSGYAAHQLFLPAARIFLGIFRPMSEVAYFSVVATLCGNVRMPATQIAAAVLPAVSVSAGRQDADESRRLYLRGLRWSWISLAVLGAVAAAIGGDFISLWIGPDFGRYCSVLVPLMALGVCARYLGTIPEVMAQALGRMKPWIIATLCAGVLNLVLLIILIPHSGAFGAVEAIAVSSFLWALAMMIWAGRVLNASWREARAAWSGRTVAAAVLGGAAAFFWRPGAPPLLALFLRAASALVVMAALAFPEIQDALAGIF